MPLIAGARFGAYEIVGALGAGGMGEVYRARDLKLGREVALKVLPELVAHDAERIARFQREAQVLASLSHPNIAIIHGLEDVDGVRALVLELVEGPTLAEVIAHGSVPESGQHRGIGITQSLSIARQIAAALEAAHEQGIIHRDLKPANIKLRPDGVVKVLDFGLAKAFEARREGRAYVPASLSVSPTITSPATGMGMILGTAAYMSPEQARGKAVDKRADIWAFGCVVFEMLTGHAPFEGGDISEVMAGVIKSEVSWTRLPPETPPAIRSLLQHCLQKDPKLRLRDIGDARFDDSEMQAPVVPEVAAVQTKSRERWFWIAAVVATIAIASGIVLGTRSAPLDAPEMRVQLVTPPGDLSSFAMSPDGQSLVFQATFAKQNRLWLRRLESETLQPLAGTEGGSAPFWSPDSQSIGFFADGQVKRIDIASGVVRMVAKAPINRGGAWNGDGTIVFAPSSTGPLYRVAAAGGTATEATSLEPGQTGHRLPVFLPDNRHFLFYGVGTPEHQGVFVGSLDSRDVRRVLEANSSAVFVPPDYLLFVREDTLLAQRFLLDKLQTLGDPLPVAAHVAVRPTFVGLFALSPSASRAIAYRPHAEVRQLVWLDRSGRQTSALGAPDESQPSNMRLSPDEKTVALQRTTRGNADIWLIDAARGQPSIVTTDLAIDYRPIWSPDSTRIVFNSNRNGGLDDIYEQAVAGGAASPLLVTPEFKGVLDWSKDGRFILFVNQNQTTGLDLWVLPRFGDKKAYPIAQTPFTETSGRFSPDGKWIAYQADDTARTEIYLQSLAGPTKVTISTTGGTQPRWRGDQGEIFYVADNRLMAVPVTTSDSTVQVGTAVPLFPLQPGAEYEVSADGRRFLVNTITEEAAPITVILNWKPKT